MQGYDMYFYLRVMRAFEHAFVIMLHDVRIVWCIKTLQTELKAS